MHQDGLRYLQTADLDLLKTSYLEMSVKFNCWREDATVSADADRLLLQSSTNGGITWNLMRVRGGTLRSVADAHIATQAYQILD